MSGEVASMTPKNILFHIIPPTAQPKVLACDTARSERSQTYTNLRQAKLRSHGETDAVVLDVRYYVVQGLAREQEKLFFLAQGK